MPDPFVRPYNPTRDFDNGLHVFFSTIEKSLDHEPTRTIGSYLWYRAYVTLSPRTCIVLDDGFGKAVGYCIGTANTSSFASEWLREFTPTVDTTLVPPPANHCDPAMQTDDVKHFRAAVHAAQCSMLMQAKPKLLRKYPAHLHIDVLPEFQRKGYGAQLIEAFFEAVRREGARGVHLDMVRWNEVGRAFYARMGFEVCEEVADEVVVTLVKEL